MGYPFNNVSKLEIFTKLFSMLTGKGLKTGPKPRRGRVEPCGCVVVAVDSSVGCAPTPVTDVVEIAGGPTPAVSIMVKAIA